MSRIRAGVLERGLVDLLRKAEVADRALFLRRYDAATRGETEGTTLAVLDSNWSSASTTAARR